MSSKDERINIRIDAENKKRLEKIADREKVTIAATARSIIIDALNPELKNRYRFLDDACPMLRYLEEDEAPKKKGEGFYCLKRAPKEDKLGSGLDEAAKKYCAVCKLRDEALADSRVLKEQREKGITIEMPRCTKGGYPNEDATQMYCPEIGKFRPVYKKEKIKDYAPCKIRGSNNSNCMYLKQVIVVKGLKERDSR